MDREFDRAYREALQDIAPRVTQDACERVALHNRGWSANPKDVLAYLAASRTRYAIANAAIMSGRASGPFVDVGGFWGVFPLALRKMGHDVAMTEALRYYGSALASIVELMESRGIQVHDLDPFVGDELHGHSFGTAFCMAVLEHYPHSLQGFFRTMDAMVRAGGMLYAEVPNLARWDNRKALLFGRSVLPASSIVYRSETPFTGHHREYTAADLASVLSMAGWRIQELHAYTYSVTFNWKSWLASPGRVAAETIAPLTREVIAAECLRA